MLIFVKDPTTPITVAIVNDYPIVVAGVAHLLASDPRITVVEHATNTTPRSRVDIALFDTFAAGNHIENDVIPLLEAPYIGKVIIYSWDPRDAHARQALALGAAGFLDKRISAEQLADALISIHTGEHTHVQDPDHTTPVIKKWPGQTAGLSPREAEVVALITQGFTNDQIAQSCYLSINSVKSYIRSAYRKMGVERRSQAVLWGIQNGMQPQSTRTSI
ncbi:Transcriptional regulatory protein devR (dosR) [Dermatophilus congolensis]|uniref:Transcriptional regulatory protein devR (DosR) n=1 Tax=Dermatophilus congolensis TaxID=1863 RepID=A0AA46BLY5_9MICO|nr:Transcriptional regulatory protein devR (dosR) [Dermatophilus congolensis]